MKARHDYYTNTYSYSRVMSQDLTDYKRPEGTEEERKRKGRFIFIRIKKGEDQGKEKCHDKSMMSKEANERLKRDTQDVPLRQNEEEKIREKGLKVV